MRKFLTHEQLRVSKGIYAFKSKYVGYMLLVLEKNAKVSKSTFMPKNRKKTNSSDMKWIGISWYLPYGHRFDSFGFASCYLPRMIRGHSWFQTTLVVRSLILLSSSWCHNASAIVCLLHCRAVQFFLHQVYGLWTWRSDKPLVHWHIWSSGKLTPWGVWLDPEVTVHPYSPSPQQLFQHDFGTKDAILGKLNILSTTIEASVNSIN